MMAVIASVARRMSRPSVAPTRRSDGILRATLSGGRSSGVGLPLAADDSPEGCCVPATSCVPAGVPSAIKASHCTSLRLDGLATIVAAAPLRPFVDPAASATVAATASFVTGIREDEPAFTALTHVLTGTAVDERCQPPVATARAPQQHARIVAFVADRPTRRRPPRRRLLCGACRAAHFSSARSAPGRGGGPGLLHGAGPASRRFGRCGCPGRRQRQRLRAGVAELRPSRGLGRSRGRRALDEHRRVRSPYRNGGPRALATQRDLRIPGPISGVRPRRIGRASVRGRHAPLLLRGPSRGHESRRKGAGPGHATARPASRDSDVERLRADRGARLRRSAPPQGRGSGTSATKATFPLERRGTRWQVRARLRSATDPAKATDWSPVAAIRG
jgi:hypothetical protein